MAPRAGALIRDGRLWAALAAGPLVCPLLALLPGVAWAPALPDPGSLWPWLAVLVYPPLEEAVFRGGLQPWLARRWRWRLGPVSAANLATSLVFAALHLFYPPPLWAAGVLVPSLVFGHFRERYHGLTAPILLHAWYNASYMVLLS